MKCAVITCAFCGATHSGSPYSAAARRIARRAGWTFDARHEGRDGLPLCPACNATARLPD